MDDLAKTPLYDLHVELGARIVSFAGYLMPLQYEVGIMAEHVWTRTNAGLFDVSHMGQAFLSVSGEGDAAHAAVSGALETLTPGDLAGLAPGGMRYTVLLSDRGGVLDDLMVTRPFEPERQGQLMLVVNAATKSDDFARIAERLQGRAFLTIAEDRGLLAVQGPRAVEAVSALAPGAETQVFMTMRTYQWEGVELLISRSGYTGEDGYEISAPNTHLERLARQLLSHPAVKPIGLGARDSLRLEAGLCLYGHDMDPAISPIEASLGWAIPKGRRARADFPGAERILAQIADGPDLKRVGFVMADRAPAREGAFVYADGEEVGVVTSGGFGPSVERAIGMARVRADVAHVGRELEIEIRGKRRPATVAAMPFAPHRYFRGPAA